MNKKWEYGGVYKNYNMEGEIKLATGDGIVKVHNIFDPLPEFMKKADVLFIDPPCSKSNINSFYTKADRTDYQESYDPFKNRFFECIDEINPKKLFIEVFASNKEDFYNECQKRYKYIEIYQSFYYHKTNNKCWIIVCHRDEPIDKDFYPNNIDEEDYIGWICKFVDFNCIGDLCMGRGLVGYNAFLNDKKFVGTELNKKRLAVLVDKINYSNKY